jgi:RNA polymerase-interacting CarD/CdnL/TRCF family regulator
VADNSLSDTSLQTLDVFQAKSSAMSRATSEMRNKVMKKMVNGQIIDCSNVNSWLLKLGFGRHHKQAFPAEIC